MLELIKNLTEIAKIANFRGWSLPSDEVCPEKTYVSAKDMCRNRPENVLVLEK